jgi:outer membrane protein assembly factor BamB
MDTPQAAPAGAAPGKRWIWLWAALGAASGVLAGHHLSDRLVPPILARLRPPRLAAKDLPGRPGPPRRTDLLSEHTWELRPTGPGARVLPLPEGIWARAGARVTRGDEVSCHCALDALSPEGPQAVVVIADASGGTIALDVATGTVLWRQALRKWMDSAAAAGRLFFHEGKNDGQVVHALDARTGRELWKSPASPTDATGLALGALVAADEVLYVARAVDDKDKGMYVEALRASDGTRLWRTPLPLADGGQRIVFWADQGAMATQGDLVLTTAHCPANERVRSRDCLWALDAKTGAPRWHLTHGISMQTSLTLRQGLGVTAGDGLTFAFDPRSGLVLWSRPSARFASTASRLAEIAGTTLRIVDPRTGGDLRTVALGFAAETVIGVNDRVLVAGKGHLAVHDEQGRPVWAQPLQADVLAAAEDTVIVVTGQTLEARSLRDGSLRWAHQGVGKGAWPLLLTGRRVP